MLISVGRVQEIIATFPGNVRAVPVAGEKLELWTGSYSCQG